MIYLGLNYDNLTLLPSPGIMVNMGNHPQMALIPVSDIYIYNFPRSRSIGPFVDIF